MTERLYRGEVNQRKRVSLFMKIACISLGCPKNQVDLDVMVHILLSAGHETVADLGEADVILVNTCGFIESAKTEPSRTSLRRAPTSSRTRT